MSWRRPWISHRDTGPLLAVLFDLAVLDPASIPSEPFPAGSTCEGCSGPPGVCGRRPDVAAAGFVKAGSDLNLAYAVLSFCAGLAGR